MLTYEQLKDNKYIEYFQIKKRHDMREMTQEEIRECIQRENELMKPYMNRYENPFMHIHNFADKHIRMFTSEDEIVVQEKIDGSNAHFIVTEDGFECCGNNFILNEMNHLDGFWYWCRDNVEKVNAKYQGVSIYGEWLTPHHCEYPVDKYGEFYVFDVMENDQYWMQDRVEQLAIDCDLKYAPVLYHGKFESWKHLMSFVGQTQMSGTKGEGVVVKNQTRLNSSMYEFYIKIVDVEFQETNKSRQTIKTVNLKKVFEMEEQLSLSKSIVTVPRVRKAIFKLVESNELPAIWSTINAGEVARVVKRYVYNDCVREEPEVVAKIGKSFGRHCGNLVLEVVEELQKELKCSP